MSGSITFLPIKSIARDSGIIQTEGMIDLLNMTRDGDVYMPGLNCAKVTDRVTHVGTSDFESGILGFHIHYPYAGGNALYIATKTDLYRSTMFGAISASKKSGLSTVGNTASFGGQFCSYGDRVIFTNGVDKIQSGLDSSLSGAGSFGNHCLTSPGYEPKAKLMCVIKNHLLLGNIDLTGAAATPAALTTQKYPDHVWWSATDDPQHFGTPADTNTLTGSDYQPLADDFGEVTGMIGGDYALIFKRRAIYRMDGPPFTFTPVVWGSGTVFPNSIVRYFDDVYFIGEAGPCVYRNQSNTVELLSNGSFTREMYALSASCPTANSGNLLYPASTLWDTSGAASYKNKKIYWSFGGVLNNPSSFSDGYGVIEYDIQSDTFTYHRPNIYALSGGTKFSAIPKTSDTDIRYGFSAFPTNLKTYDNYDSTWSDGWDIAGIGWATLAGSLDCCVVRFFSHLIGDNINDGSSLPTATWPAIRFNDDSSKKLTRVAAVRPVYTNNNSSSKIAFNFTLATLTKEGDIVTWNKSSSGPNSNGWYAFSDSNYGNFHSICMKISYSGGGLEYVSQLFRGIEVEWVEGPSQV